MADGERRLAAIMYTDIVGYTSLTQKDESSTLQALEKHRSLLRPFFASHGGREIKTIGDAFLVDFQSALDALLCAVAIQQMMHDRKVARGETLSLRIGIHVGDVVERGNDILGDAVNIASRIEPLAEAGGVCISSEVYSQVGNKSDLPFVSLGQKSLKNVGAPIEVYRLVMPWDKERVESVQELDSRRVAILPFANMSPDPNDAYFADGITEEVISIASNVSGLTVISRTSVMGYKGTIKKIKEIGRELEVGSVLEGSFRKAGNRIRVTTQLIDVNNDSHVWAQSYDRELDDVFAVQSDIAVQVAGALRVKIKPQEEVRIREAPTSSTEAHSLYLKGRSYDKEGEKTSQMIAIRYYEQALELDPNYALAYFGLSTVHRELAFHELVESRSGYETAEKFARKALELDPDLAEAHAALGFDKALDKYDFEGAIQEMKRAIEINPNLDTAYGWLASVYAYMTRWDECIKAVEQTLRLDPFSVMTSGDAGTWYLYAGQYDSAIKHFRRALELDPTNTFCLGNLGLAHIKKGLIEEGLAEVKRASEIAGQGANWGGSADLAYAYVKAGKTGDARGILDELLSPKTGSRVPSVRVAGIYAVLGEKEKSLEWLERAYGERSGYLVAVKNDFVFESIRNEPRFLALLKKINLN